MMSPHIIVAMNHVKKSVVTKHLDLTFSFPFSFFVASVAQRDNGKPYNELLFLCFTHLWTTPFVMKCTHKHTHVHKQHVQTENDYRKKHVDL
jgi:hypothetical protein